jgi:hypothetical protein
MLMSAKRLTDITSPVNGETAKPDGLAYDLALCFFTSASIFDGAPLETLLYLVNIQLPVKPAKGSANKR